MVKKRKINAKGRNTNTDRFTRLPHRMQKSEAYLSLSVTARCLLFELAMIENSLNNGALYLSVRDATDRLGLSDQKATMQAFDDLIDRGFIVCTKQAHFEVKAAEQSRARCWALTWLARERKGPTNEWENYRAPAKTKERKRADRGLRAHKRYLRGQTSHRFPVVDSTAIPPLIAMNSQQTAEDYSAVKSKNGGNPGICVTLESPAHTAVTITVMRGSWWQARGYIQKPQSWAGVAVRNDNR